jgi:hypothetical protein
MSRGGEVIESSQRLGQHRWTVERTVAWPAGKAEHVLAGSKPS